MQYFELCFKNILNKMMMTEIEVLKQIIEKRKSIFPKDYANKDIPAQVVEDIVSTAKLAPNHKRTKPWKFKVLRGEEKKKLGKELQKIYKDTVPPNMFLDKKYQDIGFKVEKANTVVALICEFSVIVPEWEEIAAVAMAVQNMYLMCTAYNLGCYWSSPAYVNQVKESFQIGESQKCLGLFYIGSVD